MSQDRFVSQREQQWQAFEAALLPDADVQDFPRAYRSLCRDLAVAQSRRYSPSVTERLNRLVLRGHERLYGESTIDWTRPLQVLFREFPRCVRAHAQYVLLALFLFYGVGFLCGVAIAQHPELVHSLLPDGLPDQLAEMYDPGRSLERSEANDVRMFGFYILNNVGIALRTFGTGILFGVGAAFALTYNGIVLGGAAGHIINLGFEETFFSFVIGHGSVELTAIALSGAAGMKMGATFLAPGRNRRGPALVQAGKEVLPIVYGSVGFLVLAAFIEAFWSSSAVLPWQVKVGVGALGWVAMTLFLLMGGRRGR